MSGLHDADTIDVVAQDADGHYALIMVEERPWDADPAQSLQLRDKVNAYAGYILDGSLARAYPETADQPVRIQLDCVQEPSGEILTIIEHTREQLERFSIGWRLNVRS